jgi:sugar lactone lactonase YvrE
VPLIAAILIALVASATASSAQNPIALYERAVSAAASMRKLEALALLDSVSRAPGGLDPGFHRAFFPYHGDSAFQRIVARIRTVNPPIVRSSVAFTIAERDLHPEGIAFDPVSRAAFVGSFKGKIVRIDSAGRATDFAWVSRPAAPRVVVGLRVDSARRQLWAVVDDPRAFGDATIKGAALMQFDIESGRVIAGHRGANGAFNDVTIAPDGTAYATNTTDGSIWRVVPGEQLEPFLAPGAVPEANGITISPDGRWLFVAGAHDITRVDVRTRHQRPLVASREMVTGSFDGLYWYEGGLIGIQNGIHPGRVVRLALDAAGERITSFDILERYHPRFGGMTTAALDGRALLYIVNTQSRSFNGDGTRKDGAILEDILIARLPLGR